ncbi:hypothetical protein AKJ16_DCAP19354 [Drosera capensis]
MLQKSASGIARNTAASASPCACYATTGSASISRQQNSHLIFFTKITSSLRSPATSPHRISLHRRSQSPEFLSLCGQPILGIEFTMLGLDLNAPAPEEESVRGTDLDFLAGNGSGMEGPSVSTAVITTAAAVAVPAAQSSSAAPKSMPEWPAKHVKFWELPVGDLMVLPELAREALSSSGSNP